MKQNMRKIWLVLCMTVCLLALSGCSAAAVEEESIDPAVQMSMQQGAQQYLELFNGMTDDALIEQSIATSQKNKDTVMENALNSWQGIKDDLGAYVSSNTAEVTAGSDGYTARIDAVYENREMEFTLMVDEDLNYVTSITFNPEYTVGEKMSKAAMNTLMGMGVVFLVLIFISWLISCFKFINQWEESTKKKKAEKERTAKAAALAPAAAPAPAPAPAAVPAQPSAAAEITDVSQDTELAAVIAAAIAASEGQPSVEGLVVRSIRRVSNSNWKRA